MSFARRNFMPAPPNQPKWLAEKGPGYRPPHWVQDLVELGVLQDISWRNDISASFAIVGPVTDLVIWVEHENPEERESSTWTPNMGFLGSGPRCMLNLRSHEHSEEKELWSGDSPEDLRARFFAARFEMGL